MKRVGVLVGRVAEEAAVRLTGTTAGFGGGGDRGRVDRVGETPGEGVAMADGEQERGRVVPPGAGAGTADEAASRMVAEGAPPSAPDASGEARALAEAVGVERARHLAVQAQRMVAEGGGVHPEAEGVGEAGGGPVAEEVAEPAFPLREHLHTWLYTARAPSAMQLLPVEPRRAWVWWRLDEAARERVAARPLQLELRDGGGSRLQLHEVGACEGEWFLNLSKWRPRISARVGVLDGSGRFEEVLSSAVTSLPPERPGDADLRWIDTVHRGDHVRGIPAEYAGGPVPQVAGWVDGVGWTDAVGVASSGGDAPGDPVMDGASASGDATSVSAGRIQGGGRASGRPAGGARG
ncbi:MAG: hypothetical protein EA398_09865 [Deltaproteobacteria bacterium]|nr:MAG: hypothetical protein EA398_09865 [Deltaproteobacteria bacterium]